MIEAEWLACTDPQKMLAYLCRKRHRREALRSKLTLFGCACCRRIWHLIPTSLCRDAVQIAERYADGLATEDECTAARVSAFLSSEDEGIESDDWSRWESEERAGGFAFEAAVGLVSPELSVAEVALDVVREVSEDARQMSSGWGTKFVAAEVAEAKEQKAQAQLLREAFGNPFRPVVFSKTWQSRDARSVAQVAYGNPQMPAGTLDHLQLAILADALEEAGCTNADILDHLRSPGPHVRGCWALDLVRSVD